MSGYIERAGLLKNLGYDEKRRADVLPGSTLDIVLKEPAADVAPVVRCKGCRWGQMDDLGITHCRKYHMHKNVDGFCDEGERKEPENENTYSSI